jgi:hypothetical protein
MALLLPRWRLVVMVGLAWLLHGCSFAPRGVSWQTDLVWLYDLAALRRHQQYDPAPSAFVAWPRGG